MAIAIIGPRSYIAGRIEKAVQARGVGVSLISMRDKEGQDYNYNGMVRSYKDIDEEWRQENKIDCAVLCASLSAGACEEDEELAWKINHLRTIETVKRLMDAGVRRFLYLSTIKVYGDRLHGDITEKTEVRPDSIYAKTHLYAEEDLMKFGMENGIVVTALRLSNVFGTPSEPDHAAWRLVANDFARQIVEQGNVFVRSPADSRNFLPMSFLLIVLERWIEERLAPERSETFNVGGPLVMQMNELSILMKCVFEKGRSQETIQYIASEIERNRDSQAFVYSIDKLLGCLEMMRVDPVVCLGEEMLGLLASVRSIKGK